MEWRNDNPIEPGTSPLTRLVRKIFYAFKKPLDQGVHSNKDSLTETHYTNSPLGIPIPFKKVKAGPEGQGSSYKEAHNNKPPKKGGFTKKGMLKE